MNQYKLVFKEFFGKQLKMFRIRHQLSQEKMAEQLRISPRSYIDLEHGKYVLSALSLSFFLLILTESEVSKFLHDFKLLIEGKDHNDAA